MSDIKKIAKVIFSAKESGDIPYDVIISIANDITGAGFTQVVRCASCKHSKRAKNDLYCSRLSKNKEAYWVDKHFYCAYGKGDN